MVTRPLEVVFTLESELTIPAPLRSSSRRGMNSDKRADAPTTFRFPASELKLVTEAATLLGMKRSELVRWVCYYASNEIVKRFNMLHKA